MILFFDTETTGLHIKHLRTNDERQPHLVQPALLFTEDDGTERASGNFMVQPNGWTIPSEASAIHGITDEIAIKCGLSERAVAALWNRFGSRSDMLVAHNFPFDFAIMETATLRSGAGIEGERLAGWQWFDTMTSAAPIINLPPTERMIAAGINKPKAPKLQECIRHFFGEELINAHDALADVRACARVYFHLQSLKAAA
jgi:DNA polymerase-3 subunit epsilon